jgi:hypothetical protein
MFDTGVMLTVNDVEGIRRSAAMAPLSSDEAFRILEACDQLLRERRIVAVLADLPASWGQVRKVLNELQAIVGVKLNGCNPQVGHPKVALGNQPCKAPSIEP